MANSLKYLILCPFVFLCLRCTIANRVLTTEDGPSLGFGLGLGVGPGPKAEGGVSGVVAGVRAGLGVEGGQSKAGAGPKVGFGFSLDVGSKPKRAEGGVSSGEGVGGSSVGSTGDDDQIATGMGGGFDGGFGYWPDPKHGNNCVLGYVCPGNQHGSCNKFPYEPCHSYAFRPLTAAMDVHEVEINWDKTKTLKAQPTNKSRNGV